MDIIETKTMKGSAINVGGWPATTMRTYLNGEFLNKLESIIGDNIIIRTFVISGHGSSDSNPLRSDGNWESRDKIYLLSNGEIFSNCLTSNCYDKASYPYNRSGSTTRQLYYYYSKGTNNNSTSEAIKKYNGTNTRWWLRSSNSNVNYFFRTVAENGNHTNGKSAETNWGVAPAFRIA